MPRTVYGTTPTHEKVRVVEPKGQLSKVLCRASISWHGPSGSWLKLHPMEPPTPHQQRVHALFGRCVLRLQQYELLMKRLLANQSVTTSASGLAPTDPKRAGDIRTSTLGLLARQFFETFVVVAGTADRASRVTANGDPPTEVMFRTTMCLEMSIEDYESAKKSVADLVELRNTLTHHFVQLFDLWSEPGCEKAFEYLTASCERIGHDLEQLRGWAMSMDEALRHAAEMLQSDAAQDFIVNGIASDGVVDWERAGIVACLREATEAITIDGWTPLTAAITFIESRHPEQTPQKYGCRSWPHAIHASKRFDLRYTFEPGAAKVALYRVRRQRENRSI